MSNDEQDYPEPREFRPERFLWNGKLDHLVRDPVDIAFRSEERRVGKECVP